MRERKYMEIVAHLESCFAKHGDSPQGVDWPNEKDALTRHQVMLDVIRSPKGEQVSLLDFGCGLSHLYEYMLARGYGAIDYTGQDISEKFIAACRRKFPQITYYCMDVLEDDSTLPEFDYVVMNGVFTEKVTLSHEEMFSYFKALVKRVFGHARIGIAFNTMSKQVQWERDDLFHLPLDDLAWFLTRAISRNFVIRNDYGLFEYTTYLYR